MRMLLIVFALLAVHVSAAGQTCAESAREVSPVLSDEIRSEYLRRLEEAKADLEANPGEADSLIWFGRRNAYLGRYKEALGTFSEGIARFPSDPRMYRHRGHRLITLRCFRDAIADLEKAALLTKGKPDQIEPDGLPNARNIPTSTLQSNIWYHLGLAYYLIGDLKNARRAYRECEKVSTNNDMRVATAYWHYMTLRRLRKTKDAKRVLDPLSGDIELIENNDYLRLIKLNRGEARAEELLAGVVGETNSISTASLGYGIGNYFLYNGEAEKAKTIFRKIVNGNQWSSFGYIAAEADLARMR